MPFSNFEAFLGKFIENFSLNIKVTILEMSTEILSQLVFLNMFEKREILRKIWICLKFFFDQTSKRG